MRINVFPKTIHRGRLFMTNKAETFTAVCPMCLATEAWFKGIER